jgi:hypothetical protein
MGWSTQFLLIMVWMSLFSPTLLVFIFSYKYLRAAIKGKRIYYIVEVVLQIALISCWVYIFEHSSPNRMLMTIPVTFICFLLIVFSAIFLYIFRGKNQNRILQISKIWAFLPSRYSRNYIVGQRQVPFAVFLAIS